MKKQNVISNQISYDTLSDGDYIFMAPHLRHESIRKLYAELVDRAYNAALLQSCKQISVLDLGAGEGTVTLPFLQRGARVLAVDISERQLEQLRTKCGEFSNQLEVRCADIDVVLAEDKRFDIIVANSLLHHIPDYVNLVRCAAERLNENGVFFCFQDPMWKTAISRRDALLSWSAYTAWRLTQGDLLGGIWRRTRRLFGFYSVDSLHDNTEYHAVRDGVNQNEICALLTSKGFECEVYEYCSMHSDVWQHFGEKLNIKNNFGILSIKRHLS